MHRGIVCSFANRSHDMHDPIRFQPDGCPNPDCAVERRTGGSSRGGITLGSDIGLKESLLMLPVLMAGTLCFTCLGFVVANLAGNEVQVSMILNLFPCRCFL